MWIFNLSLNLSLTGAKKSLIDHDFRPGFDDPPDLESTHEMMFVFTSDGFAALKYFRKLR